MNCHYPLKSVGALEHLVSGVFLFYLSRNQIKYQTIKQNSIHFPNPSINDNK